MGIKLRLALDQTDFFVQSLHENAALLSSSSSSSALSPTLASSDPPSPPPSLSLVNSLSEPLTAPPPLMHSSTSSSRRGLNASRRPTLIVQRAPLLSVSSGCCCSADPDENGLENDHEASLNSVNLNSSSNQCVDVATTGLCAYVVSFVPVLFPVLSLLMISLELTARFVPDRFGRGNGVFEMFDNIFHAAAAVLVVVCALRFDRFILARLMRSFTTYFQLFNCVLYALFSFWQWQQFAQQQADTAAIVNAAIFYATTILSFVALTLVDAWPPMSHRLKIAYLLVFGLHIARGILAASAFDVETNVSQFFIDFLPQQDTNKLREQALMTMAAYVFWFALQLFMFGGGRMCVLRSRLKLYVILPAELQDADLDQKQPLFHVTSVDRHDRHENVGASARSTSHDIARVSMDSDSGNQDFPVGSLGAGSSRQTARMSSDLDEFGSAHSIANSLAPATQTATNTIISSKLPPSLHEGGGRLSMDGGNWKIFSFVKSASIAETDDHGAYRALPDAAAPSLPPSSVRLSTVQWRSGQNSNSNGSASWSLFDNAAVDDNWFVASMAANTKPDDIDGADSSLLSASTSAVSSVASPASSALAAPLGSAASSAAAQSSSASFHAAGRSFTRTDDSLQPGNMELRPVLPEGFDGEFEYRPLLASAWLVNRMLNISPLIIGFYGVCLCTLAISLFLGAPRNWLEFSLLLPLLVVSAIPIIALPDRRLLARLLRSFEYWLLVFSVVSLCVAFAIQDVAELAVKCRNQRDSTATSPACPLYIAPDFASARIFLRVSVLAFELLFAISLDAVPMRVRVKFFVLAITLGNLLRIFITTSFIEPQRAWYRSVPMALFGSDGGVLVFGSAAVRFQALLGMIMFVLKYAINVVLYRRACVILRVPIEDCAAPK